MNKGQASAVLRLQNVSRNYGDASKKIEVLTGADLLVHAGEMVALVAPSGAGKSTLLHLAGLLERPSGGEVFVGDKSCGEMNDDERTKTRRVDIGFIYQFHHLLPEFTALENVTIPQMIAGLTKDEATERAAQLLDYMHIGQRATHRPSELSGGEQQRVAIARAVANAPKLLLADEPTGNLDPETAAYVFEALTRLVRSSSLAALIATHNHELAAKMDRIVTIKEGKIVPFETTE